MDFLSARLLSLKPGLRVSSSNGDVDFYLAPRDILVALNSVAFPVVLSANTFSIETRNNIHYDHGHLMHLRTLEQECNDEVNTLIFCPMNID